MSTTRQKAAQSPQVSSGFGTVDLLIQLSGCAREAQGGLTTHAEVDRSNQNAILGEISFCRQGPE